MPMTQPEIERKLSQHSADILALYGLVEEFRTETIARFDAIDGRFDAIDGRFDAIDGRFGAIDGRFGAIDGRFGVHEGRFDRIDATLAEVLRRLPA